MTDRNKRDEDLERLGETLRSAIPPIGEAELRHDLSSRILQRIEGTSRDLAHWRRRPSFVGVPWIDWALMGVAVVVMLLFPALIPALLYHL
jgi:hypothetical protein